MTVSTLAPVTRALQAESPDASAARVSALLYLLQAWCLGLTGRPLFLPDLIVDADEGTITADQSIATDVVTVLTLDETVAVEAVAAFYSHHTDDQLRALIKVDVSWLQFEGHLRETPSRTVVDEAGARNSSSLGSGRGERGSGCCGCSAAVGRSRTASPRRAGRRRELPGLVPPDETAH